MARLICFSDPMMIFLLVASVAAICAICYGFFALIQKVNSASDERYQYEPLSGWTITGTALCIATGLGGYAIAAQMHAPENLWVGISLAVLGFLLILRHIAKKTSKRMAFACSGLLLVLGALSAVLIVGAILLVWSKFSETDDDRIRRALRD
jgi:uncharacterized membrane protein